MIENYKDLSLYFKYTSVLEKVKGAIKLINFVNYVIYLSNIKEKAK